MKPIIRRPIPGEEESIHLAHMRSINEVCILDHGRDEVKGWGNRPLENRWIDAIAKNLVWVVELDNKIHGMSFYRIIEVNGEEVAYLHSLYLTPEVLGQGIGSKLLAKLISEVRELGHKKIILESTITALDFYKKHGFRSTRDPHKVDIGGYPVTCHPMELKLV